MEIYALDIGGSSVKHGLAKIENGQLESFEKIGSVPLKTNHFSEINETVHSIIRDALSKNSDISRIGISTTGSVDKNNTVISAGHFEGYKNISWHQIIPESFPEIKSVLTANDGRASTFAEYSNIDGKSDSHIHVVVGTGVGGGLVYNGELLLGGSGQAGYIGHIKVTDKETIKCSCGKTGCLETLASSRGIEWLYEDFASKEINFSAIIELAEQGDDNAIKAIERGGYWLGIGIGNCMNIINPNTVSIGGGVVMGASTINNNSYFKSIISGIEYASHRRVFASATINKASYGNDGGMIGAAFLCYASEH